AFVAARLADFCADAANTFREVGAACHQARGRGADRRAGAIQLDAARHHLHVLLVQAFRRAMLAGDRAVVTGVDTALILFVWHIRLVIALTYSFSLERHAEFFLCGCRNKWWRPTAPPGKRSELLSLLKRQQLGTESKRQGLLNLALTDERVPIAHARRFDCDQQFSDASFRPGRLIDRNYARWTEAFNSRCFHQTLSNLLARYFTNDAHGIVACQSWFPLQLGQSSVCLGVLMPDIVCDRKFKTPV